MKYFHLCIIIFITWSGFISCNQNDFPQKPPVNSDSLIYKVLFVGNSFTFYNNGVDYHLQKMLDSDSLSDSVKYLVQKIAVSSYTLQAHYQDTLTLRKIRSDNWTFVVLQEQSTRPINNPDLFLEYATKLNNEIKKNNAKTALFMTWALKESPNDINTISSSYNSVGSKINAKVVPVGKVWDNFVKTYPLYNLYFTDDKHPSMNGTFLIACVFYKQLFNKNPTNNSYVPVGLSKESVITTRKIVVDYFVNEN